MGQGPTVRSLGYRQPGATTRLVTWLADPMTLLIDTRDTPRSPIPGWNDDELRKKYGKQYHPAGAYLGNENHHKRGAPIAIRNPVVGIATLIRYLREGYSLVLLCGCREYERCHRKVIVDLLTAADPTITALPEEVGGEQDTIPCLSVQQPWAHLIVHGFKDVENRDWEPSAIGPLLIHAGKRVDPAWFCDRSDEHPGAIDAAGPAYDYGLLGRIPAHRDEYPTGCIVGIVDLVDVVEESKSDWFVGRYGLVLKNARAFAEPIPYRGALKLFPVPRSVIEPALARC